MSTLAEAIIARHESDRSRLERVGIPASDRLGLKVRIAAIRAFQRGELMTTAVREALRPMIRIVGSSMVAGHLQGRLRSIITAKTARREGLTLADPYQSAIQVLDNRLGLSDQELQNLEFAYGSAAVRVYDTLAGQIDRSLRAVAADVIRDGLHVREGVNRIRQAFDALGITPANSFTFESIYRTQVATAYGAGRWNANQSPAIQEILWGYE